MGQGNGGGGDTITGGDASHIFPGVSRLTVDTGMATFYAGAGKDIKDFTDDLVVVPGTDVPQWRKGTTETLAAVVRLLGCIITPHATIILQYFPPTSCR